jgi:ElaB/YqjD/DUF883 family membrane-anchored ribosome-binding protein
MKAIGGNAMATQLKDYGFSDEAKNMKEKVAGSTEQIKEMTAQTGRRAAEKIDEQREPSARVLESAASTLHDRAEDLPGGEKVARIAHATADKIQATAEYVREHDISDMVADVTEFVRRYPAQMLVGGIVVGFLVGRAFRNDI